MAKYNIFEEAIKSQPFIIRLLHRIGIIKTKIQLSKAYENIIGLKKTLL